MNYDITARYKCLLGRIAVLADTAHRTASVVRRSVGHDRIVSHAKMAEPIVMPFLILTGVGPSCKDLHA